MTKPENNKKTKLTEAATLKYDPDKDYAPQVTAAGRGFVAEKIIETARAAGVPVYRDEALAETLNRLQVGDMIPRELFEVVAEVLAYIMGIDQSGETRPAGAAGSVGSASGGAGGALGVAGGSQGSTGGASGGAGG